MMLEMRELRGDDLFALLSIMSKMDVKEDIIDLFEQSQKPISVERLEELKTLYPKKSDYQKALEVELNMVIQKRGIRAVANLIVKIMASIGSAKAEIHTLLAQVCEVSVQEIKEIGLVDYTNLVIAFVQKPELKGFLASIKPLLRWEDQVATGETGSIS